MKRVVLSSSYTDTRLLQIAGMLDKVYAIDCDVTEDEITFTANNEEMDYLIGEINNYIEDRRCLPKYKEYNTLSLETIKYVPAGGSESRVTLMFRDGRSPI